MYKTFYPKSEDINREWILVDANDQTLGRLATKIASVMLGKHKPEFAPGVDLGDFVIVVNAERIRVTGNKLEDKMYYRVSGRPGGLTSINLRGLLAKHPERVIEKAVWGMLPHNRYGRLLMKKLRVYAGPDHPHAAQNPKPIEDILPSSEE
ncbi:MAG: 50S ribosomal protein L13 [Chloroflexi bacterium]|nr:50S ribosomal protein L13 [Chloroflexota bacterium]